MNAIKNKIRSQRGASITFALLLFLVCAVLSSVIIVAATTAAGRMSGMKETDQRYYAAIAAAKRLESIFDDKQVDVSYDRKTKAKNTASIVVTKGDSFDLLKDFSFYVATDTPYSDGALDDITSAAATDYTCTVTPKLDGGLLSFEISANGGTKNINIGTYNLSIVFASNIKNPDLGTDAATGKATVSWKLHSLKKGRATVATSEGG